MSAALVALWAALRGVGGRAVAWIVGRRPATLAIGVGALCAVVLIVWIGALRADNRTLRHATESLSERLAASEATSAARGRAIAALAAAAKNDARRSAALAAATKEAENAPQSDNGALAPVLDRAFERLRDKPVAGADGG